ncbi:hypothetical protein AVDCRST_MAG92-4468 [uncultured Coleofasciculus sp.]|uniref:Uncharacterized protein n=1 Tax=uncultured Coleofasciculus sp. TaxID=1267456 RepID=A0A6J4K0L8_9CYAN|nr:hypothetical protein AVDCRST_MAG92-4468 [uncultured Coleofasciculus sp.]
MLVIASSQLTPQKPIKAFVSCEIISGQLLVVFRLFQLTADNSQQNNLT